MSAIDPKDHIRLICKIAAKYAACTDEPYEDLFQVGYFGLHSAAERFKPELGNRFSTFAYPYISGEILHYLRDRAPIIRPSRNESIPQVTSLDRLIYSDSDLTLLDSIAAPSNEEISAELWTALNQLKEKERSAIVLYYVDGLYLREVAKVLNSTPQTIGRRVKSGICKLRGLLNDARSEAEVQAR